MMEIEVAEGKQLSFSFLQKLKDPKTDFFFLLKKLSRTGTFQCVLLPIPGSQDWLHHHTESWLWVTIEIPSGRKRLCPQSLPVEKGFWARKEKREHSHASERRPWWPWNTSTPLQHTLAMRPGWTGNHFVERSLVWICRCETSVSLLLWSWHHSLISPLLFVSYHNLCWYSRM